MLRIMLGDYFYFCKFTSVCLDNNMKKQRDLFNPFSPFYLKERFEYLHSSSSYSLKSSENLSLIMPVQMCVLMEMGKYLVSE